MAEFEHLEVKLMPDCNGYKIIANGTLAMLMQTDKVETQVNQNDKFNQLNTKHKMYHNSKFLSWF